MKLNSLKNKRILILGLGREGMDNFIFLRNLFPDKILGLSDQLELRRLNPGLKKLIQKDKGIKLHLGKNYLEAIKQYDVIIKSPGIPFKNIFPFLSGKQRLTSQTDIFLDNCKGTIVGVTGTKGKSTTASLIYRILKQAGLDVELIGNIGTPALSYLLDSNKKKIYVYELSSHQLASTQKSPHISAFLNIFREHLDYYQNFDDYIKAKANIAIHQKKTDYLIFNNRHKQIRKISKQSIAQKIPLHAKKEGYFIEGGVISCSISGKKETIIDQKQIPLKGKSNLQNVMTAIAVAKIFKIPNKRIIQAIQSFKPLHHRLEFIGRYQGIEFYNDSLSTIPEAAIAAVDALGENVQTMILGGFERQQHFRALAKKILNSEVKNIILFPSTGKRIYNNIQRIGNSELEFKKRFKAMRFFFVNNMECAVSLCFKHTAKGKICLLSPASPSFGIFKDYKERGELFKKYIKIYGQKR